MTKIIIRLIVKEMVRRTQHVTTGSVVPSQRIQHTQKLLQLLTPLPKEVV